MLGARLAGRHWLRGIGLEGSGTDYRVRVNVDAVTPDVTQQIPKQVDGVDVSVEVVGSISAQPSGNDVQS
jgi:hypothetical protein